MIHAKQMDRKIKIALSGVPISLYPYDFGYVCGNCKHVFEYYNDCIDHIEKTYTLPKYVAVWTYSRDVYNVEHKLNKFNLD